MAGVFNWTELDSVTEKYFLPKTVDQIFEKDPILTKLKEKKKVVPGGRSIAVPIKHDHLNRGKYGAGTTFNIAPKEIINSTELPVRGHYVNLTSDGFEEAINSGNQAVVNLLEAKMEDMADAMHMELLEALFDDPAVVDPQNKGFIGLQVIVDDNNTYAQIDRSKAANSFWRAVVQEDAVNGINLDYSALQQFHRQVTGGGNDSRNLVYVCDFTTYNMIENMLAKRNQITTVKETMANLGFETFTLFGKPVYASDKLEEIAAAKGKGILYALNFDYLTLYTLKGKDFKLTPFKEAQNNDLRAKQLLVSGNFVATKPKRLGVIKNIKF